jgi:hypothetical protein
MLVGAQTDSRDVHVRPNSQVAQLPSSTKRWALVIGVDQYVDRQIGSLAGAANDARTLASALVSNAGFPPDQVILLSTDQPPERQPTRVNILRRLSNLAAVVPKDGLLLFAYAGHGMERGGQAFLLPSDAQISDDVTFLEETAVSVMRARERIRATGVQQVILLLDACRNDPTGRADKPNRLTEAYTRGFDFDVRNHEVTAFATLYATAVGHRAYEYSEKRQGYFTWAVVEALKGGAANEKGEITLAGLVSYVQYTVPKRIGIDLGSGKEQRPFAVIEGYKADELVISLAPLKTVAASTSPSEIDPAPKSAVDPAAVELSFWETIKSSNNPEDFKAYLEQYPNGRFTALARLRAQPASSSSSPKASETSNEAIRNSRDPISGRYEGVAKSDQMGDIPLTVEIKNENGKLSGKIETLQGPAPITGGTFQNGRLILKFDAGGNEGTFTATLDGVKLSGKWELAGSQGGALELKRIR